MGIMGEVMMGKWMDAAVEKPDAENWRWRNRHILRGVRVARRRLCRADGAVASSGWCSIIFDYDLDKNHRENA